MNPVIFEIAKLLFSGISAAASAIGVWQKMRDKKKAAKAFDDTFDEIKNSETAEAAAVELVNIMPEDILKNLEKRAETCWMGYKNVLDGEFLPDEIDKATFSVQACVCRELGRIYDLNGKMIPDKWKPQWETYKCENKKSEKVQIKIGHK